MKKKYFTKWLPVEGEIKEHELVFKDNELGTIVHCYPDGESFEVELSSGVASYPVKRLKLAKLFLCSRDIQVDDKATNGIIKTVEENQGKNPDELKLLKEGVTHWYTFEQGGLGTNKNTYKVIGEISPEAIWVKEGDEFEEDEVKQTYKLGTYRPYLYKFKCPTCKTYH